MFKGYYVKVLKELQVWYDDADDDLNVEIQKKVNGANAAKSATGLRHSPAAVWLRNSVRRYRSLMGSNQGGGLRTSRLASVSGVGTGWLNLI